MCCLLVVLRLYFEPVCQLWSAQLWAMMVVIVCRRATSGDVKKKKKKKRRTRKKIYQGCIREKAALPTSDHPRHTKQWLPFVKPSCCRNLLYTVGHIIGDRPSFSFPTPARPRARHISGTYQVCIYQQQKRVRRNLTYKKPGIPARTHPTVIPHE